SISAEQATVDNAFTLVFAFDEIVAVGYRGRVNMSQVRTLIDMDSHAGRVCDAVRKTQEREAELKMRVKAKELSTMPRAAQRERLRGMGGSSGGSANMGGYSGISSSDSPSSFNNNNNKYESSKNISAPINQSSSFSKPRVWMRCQAYFALY